MGGEGRRVEQELTGSSFPFFFLLVVGAVSALTMLLGRRGGLVALTRGRLDQPIFHAGHGLFFLGHTG